MPEKKGSNRLLVLSCWKRINYSTKLLWHSFYTTEDKRIIKLIIYEKGKYCSVFCIRAALGL